MKKKLPRRILYAMLIIEVVAAMYLFYMYGVNDGLQEVIDILKQR